jgi:arginyl-tRNA synthetase
MREGALPAGLDASRIAVEPPRDHAHGDLSTNAAMVLAKPARMAPRAFADLLVARLRNAPDVAACEAAGPGFINLRLSDGFWQARLADVLQAGRAYGDSRLGGGRRINVEYVSANPTGPMHVGHGRGAVVGDALASLLAKAGFAVCREYYINDAGAQVDILARSLHLRYREALGETIGAIPEGFYPGEYLRDTAHALVVRDHDKWWNAPESAWLPAFRDHAVTEMLAMIRADLAILGVRHDVFSSERAVVASGAIEAALKTLDEQGLIYVGTLEPPKGKLPEDWEPRPQTLFRSTQFGDDVDRPLKKSDGSWTYFAADIAYHFDKFKRGFAEMIDVWGADHGGYVKRMQAAVTALTRGEGALDVKLCQLVNLFDKGEPVRMSKRAGTFVTLREAVEEVGKDVFRFVMLTRRNDHVLDFDFAKAVEQSKENPVFYVQYAHARASSVLRHAREAFPGEKLAQAALAQAPLDRLVEREEIALIRHLANWPRLVESAAEMHEPHRVAFYLQDLAAAFHGLWTRGKDDASLRFILSDAPELTMARLALVQAVAFVVASGLAVFGVEPVEEMR